MGNELKDWTVVEKTPILNILKWPFQGDCSTHQWYIKKKIKLFYFNSLNQISLMAFHCLSAAPHYIHMLCHEIDELWQPRGDAPPAIHEGSQLDRFLLNHQLSVWWLKMTYSILWRFFQIDSKWLLCVNAIQIVNIKTSPFLRCL